MGIYKVIKDFPSRNGVRQYKAGSNVELGTNSRTKALVEMGYISKCIESEISVKEVADAIKKIPKVREVSVRYTGHNLEKCYFEVGIKEVDVCA